ncbi:MAG TPA: hypothetical protein VGA53_02390, partial [Candidatus Paceibacterota bacterium]
ELQSLSVLLFQCACTVSGSFVRCVFFSVSYGGILHRRVFGFKREFRFRKWKPSTVIRQKMMTSCLIWRGRITS